DRVPSMRKMAEPFTLEHFKWWVSQLVLDSGDPWILEPFQEQFIEDVFSGKPVCWLVIPQGNGKTTLVAGLALYKLEFTEFGAVPAIVVGAVLLIVVIL